MRQVIIGLVVVVAALVMMPVALAEQGDSKFRFHLNYVSPTGDFTGRAFGESIKLEAEEAIGLEFNYEMMFRDNIGWEVGLAWDEHDVEASGGGFSGDIGEITQMPVTFSINFHVTEDSEVDFYIGPTIGYVLWGDLETSSGDFNADDEFAFGANFGVDVPFNDKWSFAAGLRYLIYSVEAEDSDGNAELDIDPFTLRAGLAVQF